jgi:hypothetical protein
MIRRRKQQTAAQEQDEAIGLSGWLYTDLMLGLVVVFLGAVVVTIPTFAENAEGEEVIVTTTTTSTTIPVDLCQYLFVPDSKRDDSLVIFLRKRSTDEELNNEFLNGLRALYENLNARPEVSSKGLNFDVGKTKIGLVLIRSGSNDADTTGDGIDMYDRLVRLFPDLMSQTPARFGYSKNIDASEVGIEALPYVERPCGS